MAATWGCSVGEPLAITESARRRLLVLLQLVRLGLLRTVLGPNVTERDPGHGADRRGEEPQGWPWVGFRFGQAYP